MSRKKCNGAPLVKKGKLPNKFWLQGTCHTKCFLAIYISPITPLYVVYFQRYKENRFVIHIYSIPKTKNFGYRVHATQSAFPNAMIFLGERDEICAP